MVATAAVTVSVVMVGGAAVMVNGIAEDMAPSGLRTCTMLVLGVVIRFAGTLADNCVAEEKVVAKGKEFHRTRELAKKFDPVRVMLNAGPPAAVEEGFKILTTGLVVVWAKAVARAPQVSMVRQVVDFIWR